MPKKAKKTTALHKRVRKIAGTIQQRGKRRLAREILAVAGIISFIIVLLQVTYPTNRTLPFTRVADVNIGSLTKRDAIDYLFRTYSSVDLTVTVADTSIKTTTDKAGVLMDFQKAADAAARYPWWQRLIPFSLFYKSLVINAKPEITLDDELAGQFAKDIKAKCDSAVKEAEVVVESGQVVLKQGADGRICHDQDIKNGLIGAALRHEKATIFIASTRQQPHKTNQVASGQFKRAQAIIDSGLTIAVMGKKTPVPREVVAGWVRLLDDTKKGVYDVGLDDQAVVAYLQTLRGDIYVAPLPTDVRTLDGKETAREGGRPGRDLDYDKTIAQIKEVLLKQKGAEVEAKAIATVPPLNYLHNYSQSQIGLERLLAAIVAEKGNYGITVTELGGMGRTASVNGDRKYVTASTYKLFIAYRVLRELEDGQLKWEDVITDGLNVKQCFEEMIVRSANRCALAYKARYGAGNIVAQMHQLGLPSIEHNSTWWATPNDMAAYLKKLERGELLRSDSRDFLLGLLKRQVWRYGIPTGIRGVQVADKVGFLEDYIHDLAIVYSPRGTYIVTVMTKGGSYAGLADVGRRVHNYLMQ